MPIITQHQLKKEVGNSMEVEQPEKLGLSVGLIHERIKQIGMIHKYFPEETPEKNELIGHLIDSLDGPTDYLLGQCGYVREPEPDLLVILHQRMEQRLDEQRRQAEQALDSEFKTKSIKATNKLTRSVNKLNRSLDEIKKSAKTEPDEVLAEKDDPLSDGTGS